MIQKTKRPLYRPYERFSGIGILAVLSVSLLVYIPNDMRFIKDDLVFLVVECLRGGFISIVFVTWYLTKKNIPEQTYNRLVTVLLIAVAVIVLFIESTRPRDFLASCIPIILFICYCFFILPAPGRIKLNGALLLSAMEIIILVFWKTANDHDRQTLGIAIVIIDCIGIVNTVGFLRLKKTEYQYFQDDEESLRFRQALSGDASLAVVVHHNDEIVDCNRHFVELPAQCGISEKYLGLIRLSNFLFIGSDVAEAFKRGDTVLAHVAGILGSINIAAKKQYFYSGTKMYLATVIRDMSQESPDDLGNKDETRIEKNIQDLPLTANEKEIVRATVQGKPDYRIADYFCISDSALERKRFSIYRKLDTNEKIGLMKIVLS